MRRLSWMLLGSLLLGLSFSWVGSHADDPPKEKTAEQKAADAKRDEDYELMRLFADTFEQIERNYVKDVDRRQLIQAAIRGMVTQLDPYSNYISPEELKRFNQEVEQEFGGIGIQVQMDPKSRRLMVMTPLPGTPAYKAGIKSGDLIMEVEGKSSEGITLEEAVKTLQGKPGTEVTLGVQHAGSDKIDQLKITRALIQVATVLGDTHKPDDSWNFIVDAESKIGYIRLTHAHPSVATSGQLVALRRQARSETGNRLPRRLVRIRQRQDFRRQVAVVADATQGPHDRQHRCVAEAHRSAITVGEMHMSNERTSLAQRTRDVRLFDVHVKQVAQQFDVLRLQRADEFRSVGHGVDQIGLVPIERLDQQRRAMIGRSRREFVQSFSQPDEVLLMADASVGSSLHRTDDRRCSELARDVNDLTNERSRSLPHHLVVVGQPQLLHNPTGSRPHSGQLEAVSIETTPQQRNIQFHRRTRKHLHRIKSQLPRLRTPSRQVMPKHKRPTRRFRNQRNRDCGSHHGGLVEGISWDLGGIIV
jgi:hypothetical protein